MATISIANYIERQFATSYQSFLERMLINVLQVVDDDREARVMRRRRARGRRGGRGAVQVREGPRRLAEVAIIIEAGSLVPSW